jgi:hypothetical protein
MAQSCRFERSRSKAPACPCTSAERAVRLAAYRLLFQFWRRPLRSSPPCFASVVVQKFSSFARRVRQENF